MVKTLFSIKGFTPYMLILFFNATVDIAHKITIQNVLLKNFDGDLLIVLSAVVNAMILLPFILLFTTSGYLSDRFSKTLVVRYAALTAIILTLLITLSYYQGWFVAAFGFTLLLATQSAIYSPAKYGLIKELVGQNNLGPANGMVQAVTIIAILGSSILFSVVFEGLYTNAADVSQTLQMVAPIGWVLIILSIFESFLAFRLPLIAAKNQAIRFSWRRFFVFDYLRTNLKQIRSSRSIWLSIAGLSAFWGLGQVVIAVFPAHYKMMTGDDNAMIIQLILAVSTIGLGLGSLLAGHWSKLHINLGIVPVGALGLFGSLLFFTFATTMPYMIVASILFGFFGGLFIVPLSALIQFSANEAELGTVLAGNNYIQNIVMVVFLFGSIVLVRLGISSSALFIIMSLITLGVSLYAILWLPNLFTKTILSPLLRLRYRLKVTGLENIPHTGGALLLGNHVSWIDWLVLQTATPRTIHFLMDRDIYNQRHWRWLLKAFSVIPISERSGKEAMSEARNRLDKGEIVALFPEGAITYTGELAPLKKGFERILQESTHPIVPFHIDGLWGSRFSRAQTPRGHTTLRRRISVVFGMPMPADSTAQQVYTKVQELSESAPN